MKTLVMKLATDRGDGGKTENYHVYSVPGVVAVKNRRGEMVNKNVVLGGNGAVYIANELAEGHDEWVLVPKSEWDKVAPRQMRTKAGADAAAAPKGKK